MSLQKYCFLVIALTTVLVSERPATAQTEARFQIVQPGVEQLKGDLKYLVELAPTPTLKKQWKDALEPLIDSFAEGVDPKKPIRIDVIVGKEVGTEMHFPLDTLKSFKANLKGLGYKVDDVAGVAKDTLLTLTPGGKAAAGKKPWYVRILSGYASIASTAAAVPANMPDPIKPIQALFEKGRDVTAFMKNGTDTKDMAARKSNFQELRRQLEAAMVFKRNEDKNDFALRKLSLLQNLNEAERFIVETEELLVSWTTTVATNGAPGKGRADLSIAALPGTDLFKSTQLLADKPSYFSNVELHKQGVVAGKINFAIDPMRVGHLKEFYKIVRPVVEMQIDKRPALQTAEQKSAAKEAAGILFDMLSDGLALGVLDGFVDLHTAGDGKHTLISGIHTVDGKVADKIVKLLPKLSADRIVKMDIQEIGDASLHTAAIPARRLAAFQKLFPGETVVYVATSKKAVWGAAGPNAVAELTAAVAQSAQPAPAEIDPRVLFFGGSASSLVDLLDVLRPEPQKIDESLSKDEQARLRQVEKELDQIRKLAVEATKSCDAQLSGEVKRVGNKVEGWFDVSECVLSFVGSVIADFAKKLQ